MIRIEMLPARHGDCIFIEYGSAKKTYRMLIDAGPAPTYKDLRERILTIPENKRHFELFVITHVDADHIEGAVRLLQDTKLKITYGDIWFNGYQHLQRKKKEVLGGLQGEFLSSLILKQNLPWNEAFGGGSVVVPDEGPLPVHELKGGMKLTILSPTWVQLEKMRPRWKKEVEAAGLVPGRPKAKEVEEKLATAKKLQPILGEALINVLKLGAKPFKQDTAPANGSSIAFLAECGGARGIFSGDAYPNVLAASLRRLLKNSKKKLDLDFFKLPHHGSQSNVSPDLIDMVACKQYIFSSNGDIFRHPDQESVARVILHDKTAPLLWFNYTTKFNDMWNNEKLTSKHKYHVKYPPKGKDGIVVEIK
jgi:beta-lactamase superfamily II metal-dependent hydrolase